MSESAKKRVLVVDDNEVLANTFGKLIGLLGAEVKIVYSGARAIEAAPEFMPDIIFLDIAMPLMDGYETARQLKGIAGLEKVELIAVTGFGQDKYRSRSEETGFDKYVVKPIEVAEIRKILKQ